MAKESGLGWTTANIDDSGGSARDIKNDITSVSWNIPRATQDVTGINVSAVERLILLADFSLTMNGVFNDASNQSHDVGKTVGSADVARSTVFVISGQTLTNECILTDYSHDRAATGEFTWVIPAVLQSGTDPTWS
jgi:hypothetical protein